MHTPKWAHIKPVESEQGQCIVPMLISQLWYCTLIIQALSLEEMEGGYTGPLCIISCNCVWIYNYGHPLVYVGY